MAKESNAKDNPVVDVLRRLKEEEVELMAKLKPVQEAISALEKIVDKSAKKMKSPSAAKDGAGENAGAEENTQDTDSDPQ